MDEDVNKFLQVRQASIDSPPLIYNKERVKYPVFRRLAASVHAVNTLIAPGENLTLIKKARLEALLHAGFMKDEQSVKEVSLEFEQIMLRLSDLVEDHPETQEKTTEIIHSLIKTYGLVINDFVFHQGNRELETIRPLIKKNTAKSNVIERAQAVAIELWKADLKQEFRLKDMAEQVEDILKREGVKEKDLPKTRIRDWIKPVAPAYASRGGRAKKLTERNG